MTGPQKHTVQTPNLRRYDWMSRVCFKPLSSGWLTVSFCWIHNLGAGGAIVAQKWRFRAGNCFISSRWSWLHPGRAHTKSIILDLLKVNYHFSPFWSRCFLLFFNRHCGFRKPTKLVVELMKHVVHFFLGSAWTFGFLCSSLTWGRWTHSDEHIFQIGRWKTTNQFFTCLILKNLFPWIYPLFFGGGVVIFDLNLGPAMSCQRYQPLALMSGHSEVWLFSWPSTKVATAEWPWWCLFSFMNEGLWWDPQT